MEDGVSFDWEVMNNTFEYHEEKRSLFAISRLNRYFPDTYVEIIEEEYVKFGHNKLASTLSMTGCFYKVTTTFIPIISGEYFDIKIK